ncbi:MAG TPA: cyanophycinase [Pyrinomonadaceae bacterium]|jgi:cyanophycinase
MRLNGAKGKLVVIGGGEDKKGDCAILKEFIRLAGNSKASVVIMTVATDEPEESGIEYRKVFKKLGAEDVHVVDVSSRKDVLDEKALKLIEQATALFFTGGDQIHVTSLLGGTQMQELIYKRFRDGIVIGGTSAGAAMMSNSMIIRGDSNCNPRFGGMVIGPGMDFLPGTMIDTHFSQRGRMGRLLTAVAHYPQDIGLGIDENTALIVSDGQCEVLGENSVTVVDAGSITYTNLPDLAKDEPLALYGVQVHVLSEGHKYNLEKRAPIEEANKAEKGQAATVEKAKSN